MWRTRSVAWVATVLLSQAFFAVSCVDGVTPDCSDAAAKCGPETDGHASDTNVALPETSTGDADAEADLDAGDAG